MKESLTEAITIALFLLLIRAMPASDDLVVAAVSILGTMILVGEAFLWRRK